MSSPAKTDGPWIVTLENFVTEEECQRFVELAYESGFEQSEDVNQEEDSWDGTFDSVESEERTSVSISKL